MKKFLKVGFEPMPPVWTAAVLSLTQSPGHKRTKKLYDLKNW